MVQPLQLKQDYVFTVVPDTWTFLDKTTQGYTSASPLSAPLTKQTSTIPSTRSKFLSPSKRKAEQTSNLAAPTLLSTNQASDISSQTPDTSCTEDIADKIASQTPKRPRTDHTLHNTVNNSTSHTPPSTPTPTTNLSHINNEMKPHSSRPTVSSATSLANCSISRATSLLNDTNRPQWNRHPTKKVLQLD
ncbi:hypothetical protein AOQ84DRAFT_382012 [Glonium stellatum]|uniref:Uncharacterized protein n=1 Tax=Glonium stellatum TaxID=574774 RepID=A0A8E2JNC3_9PEZI|nr:hypothetical protein AOQ84DRAFT_382012 [Glonium stellatum]